MRGFLEPLTETRLYRLCRTLMLVFAAFYVAMVAVNAVQYTGAAPGIAGFTLQTLKADVIDVLSVMSYELFGYPLGVGTRPVRYALLCEQTGQATEADNAITERQVRGQLVDNKSGTVHSNMIAAFNRGDT
jgi:hypothetical protein